MRARIPEGILVFVVAGFMVAGMAAGCGERPGEPQAAGTGQAPATAEPAAPATSPAAEEGEEATAEPERERLVPPIRGTAQVGFLAPKTRVEKDMVITVFQVKNLSTGSIAGLKIDEFWWDRGGNPVTGDTARLTSPLKPGGVATMTLETPRNPKMFRNTYQFTHAYGRVETKQLKALE